MNILILSCGTRNKVVSYFKAALSGGGNVVTTDCNELAPALYEGDRHYKVPRMTADGYVDVILGICEREKISGVLSLIDPELSLLAKNRERFAAVGTTVIGSDYDVCERCLNKYEMYKWLSSRGYKCARSYMIEEEFLRDAKSGAISYPVFVKPEDGSASIDITTAEDYETVHFLATHGKNMMIQEMLSGQEIGADVYVDMISGEVVSIFAKKKLLMRAGETDKAVSFKDARLFSLIERFALESGFCGQIDVDLFDIGGEYYISEVNPRFGGGYPHAYECGCDHMKLITENLAGRANEKQIGNYPDGVYMMKYSEIMIKKL